MGAAEGGGGEARFYFAGYVFVFGAGEGACGGGGGAWCGGSSRGGDVGRRICGVPAEE